MQTRAVFPLWRELHEELLRWVDLVPDHAFGAGDGDGLAASFGHVAAAEEFWRRAILERAEASACLPPGACPDRAGLRARLAASFDGIERLLDGSLVEALVERPVKTGFPVRNALEALSLCQLHTVHHRALIAARLAALGVETGDWL